MTTSIPPYRGWDIEWAYGYYHATGPNYDASTDGPEGSWIDNGERTSARTLLDLYLEIDVWEEENRS